MNYCDLDAAFQAIGSAPSPGCENDYSTKMARKEERRKARRCKGPPATYLDINGDKDPDRQNLNKLPEIPPMNPATGLREHAPVTAPQGSKEPFVETFHHHKKSEHTERPEYNEDPLQHYLEDETRGHYMAVPMTNNNTITKKRFFGASGPTDEPYADYIPDQQDYKLQPDFLKAFEHSGVAKAGASATLPNPSVNMYWKPLTTSGAQTSFIEQLPPPGGKYYRPSRSYDGEISMEDVMKKMDKIFARLDDMNQSSPEQITSELLMFISSGIFVLFLMDLLVKKGSKMRF